MPILAISKPNVGPLGLKGQVTQVKEKSWVSPFLNYLKNEALPTVKREAHKLQVKSKNGPWLKCLTEEEAKVIISKIHEGE